MEHGVATPDEKKHAAAGNAEEKRRHRHARRRIVRVSARACVLHTVCAEANVLQRGLARQVGDVPVRGLPLADFGHRTVRKRHVGIQRREVAVQKSIVAKASAGAWFVDQTGAKHVLHGQTQAAGDCKKNRAHTTAEHGALVRAIVSRHSLFVGWLGRGSLLCFECVIVLRSKNK